MSNNSHEKKNSEEFNYKNQSEEARKKVDLSTPQNDVHKPLQEGGQGTAEHKINEQQGKTQKLNKDTKKGYQ